jgi:hypothetical protein
MLGKIGFTQGIVLKNATYLSVAFAIVSNNPILNYKMALHQNTVNAAQIRCF